VRERERERESEAGRQTGGRLVGRVGHPVFGPRSCRNVEESAAHDDTLGFASTYGIDGARGRRSAGAKHRGLREDGEGATP
jgi:hypothetical protein